MVVLENYGLLPQQPFYYIGNIYAMQKYVNGKWMRM